MGEFVSQAIAIPTIAQDVSKSLNKLVPTEHEMMVYHTMAKQAVQSKMYRGIGDESAVMMIMLAARELNIPPMQALNRGLHIIEGVIELPSRTMAMMIRRCGHSVQVEESTDSKCTVVGKRADNGDTMRVTYTIEEAKRAGLVKEKGPWMKNPGDMCYARALSRLARRLFPDVIGNSYVEGEIPRGGDLVEVSPSLVFNEEPKENEEDSDKAIQSFLQSVPKEEAEDWKKYIKTVSEKLNWDIPKTVHEFSQDITKTTEKFEKWRKKVSQN